MKEAADMRTSRERTLSQPVLAGREREIQFLKEHFAQASAGKGSFVLISGEAGIGKSRLAEDFGRLAAEEGGSITVGRCLPGAPIPYLPFRNALREGWQSKADLDRQILREASMPARDTGLMGWIRGPRRDQESMELLSSEVSATLISVLEFLRNLSTKRLLLVILEDLQWSDSASLQLLHFLARNLEGLRALIIGTYRPEDLLIEGAGVHPLVETLRIMRREGVCHELTLDSLNLKELKLAVEGMIGDTLEPELLSLIEKESGGNPLFAVEMVRLLVQANSITHENGLWKPRGQLRIDVPSTVREVILRRIERLTREDRRLLDYAAVIGEGFDPKLIERGLSINRLALLETLALIERNSQLIKANEKLYRFSHETIQHVTYDQIPSALRSEYHRIIAQAREELTPDNNRDAELSYHFYHAGETEKCLKYSLRAGRECLNRFALTEAATYFQRSLEVTKNDAAFAQERMLALEGLGDANNRLGLFNSARVNFGDFLKLSPSPRDAARVLRKTAQSSEGSIEIIELLDKAERCSEIDPIEIGRIKILRGRLAEEAGQPTDAERLYSEAASLFTVNSATEDLARTLLSLSDLYHGQGLVQKAVERAEEAALLFSKIQSVEGGILAPEISGILYFHLGLVEEALENFRKLAEIGVRLTNYALLARSYFWRAVVDYSVGDFESCRLEARQARAYILRTEARFRRYTINCWLARSEIRVNRLEEGEKLLAENREFVQSLPEKDSLIVLTSTSFDEAKYLAAKKEWVQSNARFRRSLQIIDTSTVYHSMFRAIILIGYGEALKQQGLRDEARVQFNEALKIFEKMGNTTHAQRVTKLLADLG